MSSLRGQRVPVTRLDMQCAMCHEVHFPMQLGPTNKALEHIEAVREREHQFIVERRSKKEDARKYKRDAARTNEHGKKKERARAPVISAKKGVKRPFGILNNAKQASCCRRLKRTYESLISLTDNVLPRTAV
ncbi:hypothetical protein BD309DRAFT_984831 [Dichomitus squalens]|nr:hypothetical protein BD309DRAFT_984831 [Dichomitus squalens]